MRDCESETVASAGREEGGAGFGERGAGGGDIVNQNYIMPGHTRIGRETADEVFQTLLTRLGPALARRVFGLHEPLRRVKQNTLAVKR